MKRTSVLLACAGLLFCSLGAHAGTVYHVERTVGAGSVTGTIETDGTIGALTPANIISWSFVTDDGSDPEPITISSAGVGGLEGDAWPYLSATESELLFDFDGAFEDQGVYGIGFNDGGDGYSVTYGLAGFVNGKVEQLVHFFDYPEQGQHYVETRQTGVVVIGRTGRAAPRGSAVVHNVSFGGPDICESIGRETGCDANYSGSAVLHADGTASGQFVDVWEGGGGLGFHASIDCLYVAGNDAWMSGVIDRGTYPDGTPDGLDLSGWPVIVRVRDNGVAAGDPDDAVSFPGIGLPIPCYMAPEFRLRDYVHGQVHIR